MSLLENIHCFTQNVKHIRAKLSQSPTQRVQKAIVPVVPLHNRAATHLNLVPSWRMRAAIPSLPHTPVGRDVSLSKGTSSLSTLNYYETCEFRKNVRNAIEHFLLRKQQRHETGNSNLRTSEFTAKSPTLKWLKKTWTKLKSFKKQKTPVFFFFK